MYLRTLLWIVCFVFTNCVFAQHIDLSGRTVVGNRMGYWRDAADTVTIGDVSNLDFKKIEGSGIPNFGFDRAAYWFKMEITNHAADTAWLLEIDFAPLIFIRRILPVQIGFA
jgi:hypothetical protein